MENQAIWSYTARHSPEILEQFKLVLSTVSMKETVEQVERENGPSGTETAAQIYPTQDTINAMSNSSMNGKLG